MINRSQYNLSFNQLSTFNAGQLYPVGMLECLPGDFIRLQSAMFVRAQPLVRPLMHSVKFNIRYFFVPLRIVWDGWEDFRTPNSDPDFTPPVIPQFIAGSSEPLMDALSGFPVNGRKYSELPIRVYNKIVNDAFYSRYDFLDDRDLHDRSVALGLWPKDYFTSARTAPQLGSEAEIPLTIGANKASLSLKRDHKMHQRTSTYNPSADGVWSQGNNNAQNRKTIWPIMHSNTGSGNKPNHFGNWADQFEVDLQTIASNSGISISDLQRSIAEQKWNELYKRIGVDEHVDWLRAVGVTPADSRHRKAEYLGGTSRTMSFSEVLSTASTSGAELGEMAGQGASYLRSQRMAYVAPEDGIIMAIAHINPNPVYSDAQNKAFMRKDREDFWQPEREGIGDQIIRNEELYAKHNDPNGIFGYQDRHGDYMRSFDRVTGQFRKGNEMPAWHWARMFNSPPALNASLVKSDPDERVFSDSSTSHFIAQIAHNITARRPVSRKKVL